MVFFSIFSFALIGCLVAAGVDGDSSSLRVATFNCALNRPNAGDLLAEVSTPSSEAVKRIAATVQHVNPDVLLLAEVDYDETGATYDYLRTNYFEIPQTEYGSNEGIYLPYAYPAVSNTGELSGMDINGDGEIALPDDAYGFGNFPGQYAFVIYSRYPLDYAAIRTFRLLRWADMPDNLIPDGVYAPDVAAQLRLSSKNHVDVPVILPNGKTVHVLASHPTPPVFDSDADENGRRNADEIRFWARYITPGADGFIVDDNGVRGGLAKDASFFILGDMNADPYDGDSREDSIPFLLSRYNVIDPLPSSVGGAISTNNPSTAIGDPRHDTTYFHSASGNIRCDYVLPSSDQQVVSSGVFWPTLADGLLFPLGYEDVTSDHRSVYVDVLV